MPTSPPSLPVYQQDKLRDRVLSIRALQCTGKFPLAVYADEALPSLLTVAQIDGKRQGYGDYYTPWGRFTRDWSLDVLVLTEGTPPADLPQVPLCPALAEVYPTSGFTRVRAQGEDGETLDLDIVPDREFPERFLKRLNTELAETGYVVWKLLWKETTPPAPIRLANDHALAFGSSAIWDTDPETGIPQLVAGQFYAPSQQVLKALYGNLVTNSRKFLTLYDTEHRSHTLAGARRGYTRLGGNLTAAHAHGHLMVLEHPLASNPAEQTEAWFYVLGLLGEDVVKKFAERLDLAIPWPVQPDWAETLLNLGQEANLVVWCEQTGPDTGKEYACGLHVSKDTDAWQAVISTGLQTGALVLTA